MKYRAILGVIAVALAAAGAWAWAADNPGLAGAALRVSALIGAIVVAWPALADFRRHKPWWALAGALLVAWRPRAAWLVLPVLALVAYRRSG